MFAVTLLLATSRLFAQGASFEDAVMKASDGMIIRGTVTAVTIEGKDTPLPKIETGQPRELRTLWSVKIDECYFGARKECDKVESIITISAVTGMVVERDGVPAYGEIITNATALAVTSILETGRSYLFLVRPDHARPDTYQIVPVHNGCSRIRNGVIDVELRRYDLLSEAAKSSPANVGLEQRRADNPRAPYFSDTVALKDLSKLIMQIRGDNPNTPTSNPQTPKN